MNLDKLARQTGHYPVSKNCFLRPAEPAWKLTTSGFYSISGVPVEGQKLRHLFLDESGTSGESTLVVAGALFDVDKQYWPVQDYLQELLNKYVPKEHHRGFVFHACDLYHGTGKTIFDRRAFPLNQA